MTCEQFFFFVLCVEKSCLNVVKAAGLVEIWSGDGGGFEGLFRFKMAATDGYFETIRLLNDLNIVCELEQQLRTGKI